MSSFLFDYRHKKAISNAKLAISSSHEFILETLNLCTHLREKHFEECKVIPNAVKHLQAKQEDSCSTRFNTKEHPNSTSSADEHTSLSPSKAFYFEESFPVIEKLLDKYLPILKELAKKATAHEKYVHKASQALPLNEATGFTRGKIDEMKRNKQFKIKPRSLLGLKSKNDWIFSVNIGNVMHLSLLKLEDLALSPQLAHEICRDALYEKVIMTAIAYFSLATEYRLLNDSNGNLYQSESKYWHKAAVELACTFIPSECPLVAHIVSSYDKYNSLSQEIIVHLFKLR
eukprot:TRINITY_DN10443_c0_g5_i1.p1 TRINITY_DN10443_c0_g5~~TRINITY_DN10443_c0_g5_i1.p1  ORF type:complete len:287 (+),score=64.98 TRINITY_DN10443_c0_g5_i1:641-1501(+)